MMVKEATIPARLIGRRAVSEELSIFRIGLDRDFRFRPGQYATISLTHAGVTTSRPYSIASSPSHRRELEFFINLIESGCMTSALWSSEVLDALQEEKSGTSLSITGPNGRFVLDPEETRDLVFVASGTGLSPFMSMIRWLEEKYQKARSLPRRNLIVIHGARLPENLGYDAELRELAALSLKDPYRALSLAYLPTISRPAQSPGWRGLTGRAEAHLDFFGETEGESSGPAHAVRSLLRAILRPERHAVFVCGHSGTVDNVVRQLEPLGFRQDADLKREW